MTYTQERDEFIGLMVKEGVSVTAARKLMSMANTLQRLAELECSSETADRDRVPCPVVGTQKPKSECLCDTHCLTHGWDPCQCDDRSHSPVPRIAVQGARLQKRIEELCKPLGIVPKFGGDPRGAVLKLKVPSGAWNGWGGKDDGICVPSKGFTAAQFERICR